MHIRRGRSPLISRRVAGGVEIWRLFFKHEQDRIFAGRYGTREICLEGNRGGAGIGRLEIDSTESLESSVLFSGIRIHPGSCDLGSTGLAGVTELSG